MRTEVVAAPNTRVNEVLFAAHAVHAGLSDRTPEACREALAIELARRGIRFVKDAKLPLFYKGKFIGARQPIDFVVGETLVLVRDDLGPQPPLLNLLRLSGFEEGLWLDFGSRTLVSKRVATVLPSLSEG